MMPIARVARCRHDAADYMPCRDAFAIDAAFAAALMLISRLRRIIFAIDLR